MGYNTVAVIYNDHEGDIAKSGEVGARLSKAMRGWFDREKLGGWFGAGQIISMAHADSYQIVIVHANTGHCIEDANELPSYVLESMAYCLLRHGWIASRPKKTRPPK